MTRVNRMIVVGLLGLHALLLAWAGWRHSPTWDEVGHLVAGLSHWELGRFELYRVNPPLVRMVATLPLAVAGVRADWQGYSTQPSARSEHVVGLRFVNEKGGDVFWLFTLARWACIPLICLGGYVCFRWATELYGVAAGRLALLLWCLSPNILAHGQLISPDAGATSLGVAGAYVFWRWLKRPCYSWALCAGIMLGLIQLTKMTWVVLFLLWPVLWLAYRGYWSLRFRPAQRARPAEDPAEFAGALAAGPAKRELAQLAAIILIGIAVLNLGYGCEGSLTRLGDYPFYSAALAGTDEPIFADTHSGNRFRDSWLGRIPVPLPDNYVRGVDLQKRDFEIKFWSYLRGRWQLGGWWYYYLIALAIKMPLGTWGLALLAVYARLGGRRRTSAWRDEMVLLAPLVAVLGFVSSQTGINIGLRYVLPILPFAFIWISRAGQAVERVCGRDSEPAADGGGRPSSAGAFAVAGLTVVCALWSSGSSLLVYPHSLSYFNELVGGPKRGAEWLLDSNIDFGQDLLYLRRWLDVHPETGRIGLAYFLPHVDPKIAGIDYEFPPIGAATNRESRLEMPPREALGPQPGWYVLSVNEIHRRTMEYDYFLRFKPVAMIGYSTWVYHISVEEANRVRRDFDLPLLPPANASSPGGAATF